MNKRNIKLGIYGFLFMLLVCMITLKPYLPTAIYHNFPGIDDYHFFVNRVVKIGPHPEPWPKASAPHAAPSAETETLLRGLKTTALLMIENGEIVFERYDHPADGAPSGVDEISGSFSMAKSIVGLLTGFAIQEGALRSLDESIGTYITEWADRDEGKITIKNLLQMASGLDWNESYWNPFSVTTEIYYGTDLKRPTLMQHLAHSPGSRFEYQSGTSQLLGLVLARATQKTLSQYASEKLWKPLGAEHDALWSLDHEDGMEKAYCCFNATARDFARLGQFVLQGGQWKGKQLLNAEYLRQMLTPMGVEDRHGKPMNDYGFQWWLYPTESGERIPYARGILGQYVVLVPQKHRVVVRLGMKRGNNIGHHPEEVKALYEWAK